MGPENRVEFEDGSDGEFDIVLLNTGLQKSSFEGFALKSMKDDHDHSLFRFFQRLAMSATSTKE